MVLLTSRCLSCCDNLIDAILLWTAELGAARVEMVWRRAFGRDVAPGQSEARANVTPGQSAVLQYDPGSFVRERRTSDPGSVGRNMTPGQLVVATIAV